MARLHMDSLASKTSVRKVRRALETLPTAIDETYDEAMARIEALPKDDSDLALRVLEWVTCATGSLSLPELQCALAIELQMRQLDSADLEDEEIMISVCAGLVVVDEESQKVHLVRACSPPVILESRTGLADSRQIIPLRTPLTKPGLLDFQTRKPTSHKPA